MHDVHDSPPQELEPTKLLLSEERKQSLKTVIHIVALRTPIQKIASVQSHPALKNLIFRGRRIRNVRDDSKGDTTFKEILLDPKVPFPPDEMLPEAARQFISSEGLEILQSEVELPYTAMSGPDALKALLGPKGITEVPVAFETIGHIAHYNLRDALLPYKAIIGQVTLEKNPNIRTVVNKATNLDGEFRVIALELLAGEEDFNAWVKENGVTVNVPFDRVYWNSRLSRERELLLKTIPDSAVLVDVMAGVGALPCLAAKYKNATVFANDLNSEAFDAISVNATLNKVNTRIRAYNMDGREFLSFIWDTPDLWKRAEAKEMHIVMNLPEIAVEFLDALAKWRRTEENTPDIDEWKFVVHCHCFVRSNEDAEDSVRPRVEESLGYWPASASMREVRSVAPQKIMFCLEFKLNGGKHVAAPSKKRSISSLENSATAPSRKKGCVNAVDDCV